VFYGCWLDAPLRPTLARMATDDEERQAQEREAAERRAFEELTWPVWGSTGHESLYMHLDEGVVVLFECTRCGAVVAALGLHEQATHPDEPLRKHKRWDTGTFVMPSRGRREMREVKAQPAGTVEARISFDCPAVDGEGVHKVITDLREIFTQAGWAAGGGGGSRREGPIWNIRLDVVAPGHEVFADSPVIVEALNAAGHVGATDSVQISIEVP
jgi:hypothetical protein